MEERYLPYDSKEKLLENFTNELLLGSQNTRYKKIFPADTKALFCFFRDKTLFINFSSAIIEYDIGSSDIQNGFDLYRENILYNFKSVKNIRMFAAGHEVL